jgi:hypothetical protein
MTWRVVVVAAVLVGGCASTVPTRWEKPGAATADYERDSRACAEEAGTETLTNRSAPGAFVRDLFDDLKAKLAIGEPDRERRYVQCMETRGWRPAKP